MNHKTKHDLVILNLISDFEESISTGRGMFLSEKSYFEIIEYYHKDNQLKKALSVTDMAIKQFNFQVEYYLRKANILKRLNRPQECLAVLDKAEEIAPFELDVKLMKIKVFAYSGNITGAQQILAEVKSYMTDSEATEVLLSESYIHEVTQEYDQMYSVLKKAISNDPHNDESLDRFWIAIEFSKNYYNAIQFLLSIIDRTPYSYLAWYNLGEAYSCVGEYSKAIDALEYSFIIKPDFQVAYYECADICIQEKNHKKALEIYKEALVQFGADEEVLLNMAECQKELGNLSAAKYNLYKALKFDPYNDEVYFKLGSCYAIERNWNNAIKAFHKAISIEENTEDYYLGLAESYYSLGSFEKADFFYRKATTIAPEDSSYWSKYATFLIKTGERSLALQLLRKAEDFTFGADLLYCQATASILEKNEKGYLIMEEALQEDFSLHPMIFQIEPELALDKKIIAMINYFR